MRRLIMISLACLAIICLSLSSSSAQVVIKSGRSVTIYSMDSKNHAVRYYYPNGLTIQNLSQHGISTYYWQDLNTFSDYMVSVRELELTGDKNYLLSLLDRSDRRVNNMEKKIMTLSTNLFAEKISVQVFKAGTITFALMLILTIIIFGRYVLKTNRLSEKNQKS